MEDEYLDKLLDRIKNSGDPYLENFIQDNADLTNDKQWKSSFDYLEKNKYIKLYSWGSHNKIGLTPDGEKLLHDGGFKTNTNYKRMVLKYAKDSRDYSRRAYYVAIVGVIVSIILFLLSKYKQ